MEFARVLHNEPNHDFSLLPFEIICQIIQEVGNDVFEMQPDQTNDCTSLIFENFSVRKQLIASRHYDPESPNINCWWSQKTRGEPSKTLFRRVICPTEHETILAISEKIPPKTAL